MQQALAAGSRAWLMRMPGAAVKTLARAFSHATCRRRGHDLHMQPAKIERQASSKPPRHSLLSSIHLVNSLKTPTSCSASSRYCALCLHQAGKDTTPLRRSNNDAQFAALIEHKSNSRVRCTWRVEIIVSPSECGIRNLPACHLVLAAARSLSHPQPGADSQAQVSSLNAPAQCAHHQES